MSPRRRLPAGIRGRGAVFTYTWRDAAGRQYSRKAGDTLEQAEAFKRRGTPSIGDAVGLGAAVEYVMRLGMAQIAAHEHRLTELLTAVLGAIPGVRIVGTAEDKIGVASFVVDGVRTERVGAALDTYGIAVRAGHHCAQPALRRFGLESTARASLAFYNTEADISALGAALRQLVPRVPPRSPQRDR